MASRGGIVSAVLVFVATLALAGVGGCNIHEFGHLVTGRAFGVPVDHITWCTPVNGRIAFSYQEPALVSYAGGFTAALALGAVYRFFIWPRLAAPLWWAAGVAVLGTAVSQVIVGVMVGASPQGYARAQGNVWGLALVLVLPWSGRPSYSGVGRRRRNQATDAQNSQRVAPYGSVVPRA